MVRIFLQEADLPALGLPRTGEVIQNLLSPPSVKSDAYLGYGFTTGQIASTAAKPN